MRTHAHTCTCLCMCMCAQMQTWVSMHTCKRAQTNPREHASRRTRNDGIAHAHKHARLQTRQCANSRTSMQIHECVDVQRASTHIICGAMHALAHMRNVHTSVARMHPNIHKYMDEFIRTNVCMHALPQRTSALHECIARASARARSHRGVRVYSVSQQARTRCMRLSAGAAHSLGAQHTHAAARWLMPQHMHTTRIRRHAQTYAHRPACPHARMRGSKHVQTCAHHASNPTYNYTNISI